MPFRFARHITFLLSSSSSSFRRVQNEQTDQIAYRLPLHERMMCAAAAGIVCWMVIFPVDSLRSRLYAQATTTTGAVSQAHGPSSHLQPQQQQQQPSGSQATSSSTTSSTSPRMSSSWHMVQRVYREHGLRGFYRGVTITVLRAGPVAAAVLPMYDLTLDYLSQQSE